MELISIVVPVYNKDQYLEKTLNEIRNQTYGNIEIICLDDCSTDKSRDILLKNASIDSRVRLFYNERHLGAAESRNLGLKHCNGEYVIFLDADDEYDSEMLLDAYEKISEYKADVSILPFVRIGKNKLVDIYDYIGFGEDESEIIDPKLYGQNLISKCDVVVWNKLYRVSYLKKNNLEFQDLTSSNDVYFGVMSVCLADKIALVKKKKSYINHFLGIMGQISNKRDPMNAYIAWKKICDDMKEKEIWSLYREMILKGCFFNIKNEMARNKDDQKNKKVFEYFQNNVLIDFDIKDNYSDISNCQAAEVLKRFLLLTYNDFMVRISFVKMLDKCCSSQMLSKLKIIGEESAIIVWGAGVRANDFIEYMKLKGINISIVVDKDASKHKPINEHGLMICGWNEVKDKVGCVCVLRDKYFKDIYSEVRKEREEIEVINFEGFYPYEIEY